jgi:hypothetical protein
VAGEIDKHINIADSDRRRQRFISQITDTTPDLYVFSRLVISSSA